MEGDRSEDRRCQRQQNPAWYDSLALGSLWQLCRQVDPKVSPGRRSLPCSAFPDIILFEPERKWAGNVKPAFPKSPVSQSDGRSRPSAVYHRHRHSATMTSTY